MSSSNGKHPPLTQAQLEARRDYWRDQLRITRDQMKLIEIGKAVAVMLGAKDRDAPAGNEEPRSDT